MKAKTLTKYSNKSIPKLLDLAAYEFNRFIRKRDSNEEWFVCISCGQTKKVKHMHAGHFYPAGHHPELRFNENNVHGQCVQCNFHKHGNLIEYRKNLIGKIGTKAVEKLDFIVARAKQIKHKWDRFNLISIIEKYRELNRLNR